MKLDLSIEYDLQKSETYFKKLVKKGARIELKEFKAKRSLNQNSYLHACFGLMGLESGYTIEELKVITKREFGSFMTYEKNNTKFLRSTADLDKTEFAEFTDYIRSFSFEQLGLYIPTPEEWLENQFELLKETQYAK